MKKFTSGDVKGSCRLSCAGDHEGRLHPDRVRVCGVFAAAVLAVLPLGCSSAKRANLGDLDEARLESLGAADAAASREMFKASIAQLVDRVAAECDRHEAGEGPAPTLDFLALSGGGDFGAFGAGLLVGWGQATDAAYRRPTFDAVTGVSTGALLAPFAYIGTDESCVAVEDFYRNPKKDWVQSRGMLFFLPSFPSFMTIPGLERDLRKAVDDGFIADLAEQRKSGRLLAISATNLDLGSQRFWELGDEAAKAVASGDMERVRRILLASAAIPAVFPPVEIDEFYYADGGVTANVFLRLDPVNPDSFLNVWKRRFGERPIPKVRYWIIVNNQLRQPPKAVKPRWPAIVGPSLATSIRSATIAEVRWLTAQAEFVNATWGTDIEVRLASIPNDWRAPVPGDFQKETMASLADLGRRLGADPGSWQMLVGKEEPVEPGP